MSEKDSCFVLTSDIDPFRKPLKKKIKQLQSELDTANKENERLRTKINEALDVLPVYPACAKECLLKALPEGQPPCPDQ